MTTASDIIYIYEQGQQLLDRGGFWGCSDKINEPVGVKWRLNSEDKIIIRDLDKDQLILNNCRIKHLIDSFETYKNVPYEHRSKTSSEDILDFARYLYHSDLEKIYAEEEREEYMNELGLDTDDDSSDDPDSDYDN